MDYINIIISVEAEFIKIGRKTNISGNDSLIVFESNLKPRLLIKINEEGFEVYTIPKRILVTIKPMKVKQFMQKLEKLNYLSEEIKFYS